MSQPSRDPVLVQCNDCGGMTESAHDYAQISYLKTHTWRCPECYHKWRGTNPKERGRLMSCQVPHCTATRLPDSYMHEVCDPVTRVVAFVCPAHFDHARAARLHHGQMVDEQRSKDIAAAVTDAVSKAGAPRTIVMPGNPESIKHIAATLAVVAPDLDETEVASIAESFYNMAQPALRVPVVADPGDADPKAFEHTCDTNPVKFCRGCMLMSATRAPGDSMFVDYLKLMAVRRAGNSVVLDSLTAVADNFDRADAGSLGIHPAYSDSYTRRLRI